jgi:DNA invertase Pin-like site-specific DNA recombinase
VWCGWTIVAEFNDQVSGRKADRPELKKVLEAGRKRKYDALLFWSLDRLSRQGVLPTLPLLNQISQYGVKYRSLQEQWIDSLGAFSDSVIGILATVARFEAERLSSRVRSELERARSQGKVLGRPRTVVDRMKLAKLRQQGLSLREIAAKTGISTMSVQRALKALD